MPVELIRLNPEVAIRPSPDGRCRIKIHATIDWATAIEIMKVMGHVGEIASMDQMRANRT